MRNYGYRREISAPGIQVIIVGKPVMAHDYGKPRRYKIAPAYMVRHGNSIIRRSVQLCPTWESAYRAAIRQMSDHLPNIAKELLALGRIDACELSDETINRFAAL